MANTATATIPTTTTTTKPSTLSALSESGWVSKPVKREIHDNFMRMLSRREELFPGIIGYDDTVIPEINIGLIAGHDLLAELRFVDAAEVRARIPEIVAVVQQQHRRHLAQ